MMKSTALAVGVKTKWDLGRMKERRKCLWSKNKMGPWKDRGKGVFMFVKKMDYQDT